MVKPNGTVVIIQVRILYTFSIINMYIRIVVLIKYTYENILFYNLND